MNRYNRHIILSEVGQEGQNKLSQAKVLVVGAGGLGCPVLQYLAAAGIGTLGIIDFDVVEESNLQRQVLFGTSTLGQNKALAAKTRLKDLNSTITINAYPEKLTSNNVIELFKNYDIIVDGSDNFATRYLINDAAILSNKPIVYGAIYKFEGQVSVFNFKDGPSYRCLFSMPPKEGSVANCSEVGVIGVLPGIIGTMQANEVIKIVLGFDNVLSGKLFCYNARTSQTSALKITKSDSEFKKVLARKDNFEEFYHHDIICDTKVAEISFEETVQMKNIQFIDVREFHEQPKPELKNCIQIPLGDLEQNLDQINTNKTTILFCQTGTRSKTAVEFLKKHNIKDCFSLIEGASGIIQHLKVNIS
jgi:sulfur-carrier protein adenylyltransferase/sulfurtransferase